ncbi:zinc finger protein PLAG1-like [Schistocerca serialis cubense]|uniref:zinc finger protein PLAG1-like n=1 Tax=Schistocerca serialis cubense TaxID=2023355 RepID=UPI00214E86CD|nr:zinc finger protein PLAG1-like [Schistocerca serialis cubense]
MFDDSNLWCEDCEHSNTGECNQHGPLIIIPDSSIISRARQSLPSALELRRNRDTKHGISVFTRENIKRRTRFGPLQAPRKSRNPIRDRRTLPFKLFLAGRDPQWFDTESGNEGQCNWMIFVAVARSAKEQNLAAFQYQSGIYFVTTKDITAGEELRVWYAKEYAACMGTSPLHKTEETREEHGSSRQLRPRPPARGAPPATCRRCHRRLVGTRQVCNRCATLTKALATGGRSSTRRGLPTPAVMSSRDDSSDGAVPGTSLSTVHRGDEVLQEEHLPVAEAQINIPLSTTTEMSTPSTSRHTLRSGDTAMEASGSILEGQRLMRTSSSSRKSSGRSKKDAKNEENLQRAASSRSGGSEGSGSAAASGGGVVGGGNGSSESGGTSSAERKRSRMGPSPGRHVCHVCLKAFGSPGKLSQHMYSHTGERPFECSQCKKAFSSKFKLVRHVLIHSDERRYRCTVCERTFHRKDHLKNHVKVHSPVKKTFRCEREGCGKEYSSFLSFRKHVAVHAAEEGNLECKMCGKVFANKEEIVYHLKVHAGSRTVKNPSDKKYRCDHCDRKFFTRKDVRRHLVVHTGKRDFLCQFCPQRFGRKDHLVRHIKKSHHGAAAGPVTRGRGKRVRAAAAAAAEISRKSSVVSPRPSTSKATVSTSLEFEGESSTIPGPSSSFCEVEETKDILMLEEDVEDDPLKTPSIEEILQHSPSRSSSILLKSETTAMASGERSAVTVHHRPQVSEDSRTTELLTELVYGHQHPVPPPPPYPPSSQFKSFEHGSGVKMEYPSPSSLSQSEGTMDFSPYLSLIPSTSASLSEDIVDESTGGVQEELHRLLSVGESGSEGLLVPDPNISSQFLHLMESAATSLDITGASGSASTSSEMMASLLESSEDVSNKPVPLPRFNQAFQQQQQQQPQPQQPQPQQQPQQQQSQLQQQQSPTAPQQQQQQQQ